MTAYDGILVADFSRVLAGPLATMYLADLGADVVKVERPDGGDDTRGWPPFIGDVSTYFSSINRNKRSVTLDLSDPGDLALGRTLALRADVMIENFRPGLIEKFGLGYEDLRIENPGLVYCSISGFGAEGAGADIPGFDFLAQAMGGLMSLTGPTEGPPYRAGVAVVDVLSGLNSLIGIQAALNARSSNGGRGQKVEVSLMQSILAGLINASSATLMTGNDPKRAGNRHASVAPYEVFEASDGEFILATGNDRQWQRVCSVLGVPELADDERFSTNRARVNHIVEMGEALAPPLLTRTRGEWIEAFRAERVPAGPINTITEAFAVATELGLNPIVELEDGFRTTRSPVQLSDTPPTVTSAPPLLGQHSDEIRAWLSRD